MFVFLVAVVILFSIFGLTYARTSIRANRNGAGSTIRLPELMHRIPLIQHPQPGVEGDSGFGRLSQQSLGTSGNAVAPTVLNEVDGQLGVDRYQLERSILDQKIRDANQLGLRTEALWPQGIPEDSAKMTKNPNENLNTSEASKLARQKITHTIYNMIENETFAEAMAAHLRLQQEEAVRPAGSRTEYTSTTESNEQDVSIDVDNNSPTNNDVVK